MNYFLMIFIGGGAGSLVRYYLGRLIALYYPTAFPIGTFGVNVIACFVLGLILGMANQKQILSESSKMFWAVGFCGGFSTFSTFSAETVSLLQVGLSVTAMLYVILSVVICLVAFFAGQFVAQQFWG